MQNLRSLSGLLEIYFIFFTVQSAIKFIFAKIISKHQAACVIVSSSSHKACDLMLMCHFVVVSTLGSFVLCLYIFQRYFFFFFFFFFFYIKKKEKMASLFVVKSDLCMFLC